MEILNIDYVEAAPGPEGTIIRQAVVTFTYKYARDATIPETKYRLYFPGNSLKTVYNYEIHDLSVYTTDRYAARLVLAVSSRMTMKTIHIDFIK